ncbi:hypothetical protein [Corynebacterium senegalense]|uniref:hypothetical protein n=1 Tax=Corynebacterium senegalense TaxID=2080750 RepID=UPI000E2055CB|nr:hypothetical protein [Corynebacterium senegalense]
MNNPYAADVPGRGPESEIIHEYLIPTLTYAEQSFKMLNRGSERLNRLGEICDRLVGPVTIGVAFGVACVALGVTRRVDSPVIHVITPSLLGVDSSALKGVGA